MTKEYEADDFGAGFQAILFLLLGIGFILLAVVLVFYSVILFIKSIFVYGAKFGEFLYNFFIKRGEQI